MNFKLTEEQELLLESIDQVVEQAKEMGYDREYIKKCDDESRYPIEFMQFLMETGIGLLGVPEEYGGTEADTLTLCLVNERLQRHGYPSATSTALTIDDMLTFGSPEQQSFVASKIMTGKGGFTLGITEPGAGSDNSAMATTATWTEDGNVIINGSKSFITNGDISEYILVVARDAEPVSAKEWASMYFVPIDSKGISMSPMHKIGLKSVGAMYEVHFDNVVVPQSALVGTRGKGFLQTMKNLEIERLLICANCLGIAENAMDIAGAYASERVTFNQPIGNYQLIQEMLCECEIKILNMQNFIYRTAWERDNGISIRTNVNLAKYYCARTACEVVDDCLQIMGGIGFVEDCDISRLYRDIRAYRLAGGTDQIMIHASGRQLVKKYARK